MSEDPGKAYTNGRTDTVWLRKGAEKCKDPIKRRVYLALIELTDAHEYLDGLGVHQSSESRIYTLKERVQQLVKGLKERKYK